MTNRFSPDGEQDTIGRYITIKGFDMGGAAAAHTVQVLNQTGRALTLVAANATASALVGASTADVRNATGSMLTGVINLVAATGTAGVVDVTNRTVAIGGVITFVLNCANIGDLNLQATAMFAVAV